MADCGLRWNKSTLNRDAYKTNELASQGIPHVLLICSCGADCASVRRKFETTTRLAQSPPGHIVVENMPSPCMQRTATGAILPSVTRKRLARVGPRHRHFSTARIGTYVHSCDAAKIDFGHVRQAICHTAQEVAGSRGIQYGAKSEPWFSRFPISRNRYLTAG